MQKPTAFTRPTFEQALKAWQKVLRERAFPTECLWLFEENLCFEQPAGQADQRLGFQTRFTPVPPDAERVGYRYFAQFERPLVFYRVGSALGKSVCLLLCDAWFSDHGREEQGFIRRDEWLILFHPGSAVDLPEITEQARWKNRIIRGRPVQPLDFCITLRSVHEHLAHGRMLSPYEHYALRFLRAWNHFLPHKNRLDN